MIEEYENSQIKQIIEKRTKENSISSFDKKMIKQRIFHRIKDEVTFEKKRSNFIVPILFGLSMIICILFIGEHIYLNNAPSKPLIVKIE